MHKCLYYLEASGCNPVLLFERIKCWNSAELLKSWQLILEILLKSFTACVFIWMSNGFRGEVDTKNGRLFCKKLLFNTESDVFLAEDIGYLEIASDFLLSDLNCFMLYEMTVSSAWWNASFSLLGGFIKLHQHFSLFIRLWFLNFDGNLSLGETDGRI